MIDTTNMTDREKFEAIREYKRKMFRDEEQKIADEFGMSRKELRKFISRENKRIRQERTAQARQLKAEGKTVAEIAEIMEIKESSVRLLLDYDATTAMDRLTDEVK